MVARCEWWPLPEPRGNQHFKMFQRHQLHWHVCNDQSGAPGINLAWNTTRSHGWHPAFLSTVNTNQDEHRLHVRRHANESELAADHIGWRLQQKQRASERVSYQLGGCPGRRLRSMSFPVGQTNGNCVLPHGLPIALSSKSAGRGRPELFYVAARLPEPSRNQWSVIGVPRK